MKAMDVIKVKKIVPEATIPQKAHQSDAGFDLVALDDGTIDADCGFIQYRTGISIEPPNGYHTEIFPRSSISKYDLILANSIGLVDESYRGEILVRFKYIHAFHADGISLDDHPIRKYKKGDKIAQLVLRKTEDMNILEVNELSDTKRGTGGFGSSGQ